MTALGSATPTELVTGEISVDDLVDEVRGIRYIGNAARQPDGTWRCLAEICGALCVVEVSLRILEEEKIA